MKKVILIKIKEHCRKYLCIYLSAVLSIALAFSSFFAISFYIELKSAEKRKILKCRKQERGRKNHPTTPSNLKICLVYI